MKAHNSKHLHRQQELRNTGQLRESPVTILIKHLIIKAVAKFQIIPSESNKVANSEGDPSKLNCIASHG